MKITARTRLLAAGLAIGTVSVFGAATAGAQEEPSPYVGPSSTIAPEVLSNQVSNSPSAAAAGTASPAAEVQGSALAFTGGDAAALALVGGTALAAGTGMVLARRRQTAEV